MPFPRHFVQISIKQLKFIIYIGLAFTALPIKLINEKSICTTGIRTGLWTGHP